MSDMRDWLLQLRYPYTAGVIGVMWLGSAAVAIVRPETPAAVVVVLVAAATLLVAAVGFSARGR